MLQDYHHVPTNGLFYKTSFGDNRCEASQDLPANPLDGPAPQNGDRRQTMNSSAAANFRDWTQPEINPSTTPITTRRLMRLSRIYGRMLGDLIYHLDVSHRVITLRNLRLALPFLGEKRIARLSRAVFGQYGRSLAELLYMPKLSREALAAFTRISGEQHVRNSLANGRGVILASAHTGNWECGMQLLSQHFQVPVTLVVRKVWPRSMDRWLNAVRTRFGNTVIDRKGAFPVLAKTLRRGGIVGVMSDLSRRKQSVPVKFFGHPALASHAASLLAVRCRAPIVPGFSFRDPEGRIGVQFSAPIGVRRSGNLRGDLQAITQAITDEVELAVRRRPEQWMWMQRRWKDFHPELYPFYGRQRKRTRRAVARALHRYLPN
jgi:KDO2-lipid IV(A) lauroyltransferase